jgi:actin-related protein
MPQRQQANSISFAAGRPTALVLDVGHSISSAVPVVDGYALRAGTMRQPLGSSLLLSQLTSHFKNPANSRSFPLSLLPRQLIAKRDTPARPGLPVNPQLRDDRIGATTQSWREWAETGVVDSWKEACGEVSSVRPFDTRTASELGQTLYEFPDGYQQNFGEEKYRFTEMFFDPKNYFNQVCCCIVTRPSAVCAVVYVVLKTNRSIPRVLALSLAHPP